MPQPSQDFSHEILESADAIAGQLPSWRRFIEQGAKPHFYQDLEKLLIEKQYRKRARGLLVIIIRQRGQIAAIASLTPDERPFEVRFGLLTLAAFRLNRYKLLGSGILFSHEIDPAACLRYLIDILRQHKRRFDLLIVDELPRDSLLLQHLQSLTPYVIKPVDDHPEIVLQLHLPDSHDLWLASYRKKKRYGLRRDARLLDQYFDGDTELRRITRPEQVNGFIDACHHIFDRSWKKGVLGNTPSYSWSDIPYLEQLAAKGWLRAYLLIAGGEPIAYFTSFTYRGTCYLEDLAYDKRYKKLGPGSVMIFRIIQDFYAHEPPEVLDFGYGDNTYKRVYSNHEFHAHESYIVKRPGAVWILVGLQRTLQKLYSRIRSTLVSLKLDQTVRKLIKHQG